MSRSFDKVHIRPAVALGAVAGLAGAVLTGQWVFGASSETPRVVALDCNSPDLNQRARVIRLGDEHVVVMEDSSEVADLYGRRGAVMLSREVAIKRTAGEQIAAAPVADMPGVTVGVFEGYRAGEQGTWHDDQPGMVTAICSNTEFTPRQLGDGQ